MLIPRQYALAARATPHRCLPTGVMRCCEMRRRGSRPPHANILAIISLIISRVLIPGVNYCFSFSGEIIATPGYRARDDDYAADIEERRCLMTLAAATLITFRPPLLPLILAIRGACGDEIISAKHFSLPCAIRHNA